MIEHPQTERIFEVYESTRNIRQTARQLDLTFSEVRRALQSDPVRYADIELAEHEEQGRRWAEIEQQLVKAIDETVSLQAELVGHVRCMMDAGVEETDLKVYNSDGVGRALSPMEAIQWMIEKRVMDGIVKGGFQAAKIAEVMRTLKMQGLVGKTDPSKGAQLDPSSMSAGEIASMVREMEEQGREVPENLKVWARHQLPAGSQS